MKTPFQLSLGALFVLTMLLSSCTKKELPETLVNATTKEQQRTAGDGEYDLLGYGYDATGQYANAASAGFAILDIPRIKVEKPSLLLVENTRTQEYTEEYGEDAAQYAAMITRKVDATALISLFAGSVSSSFQLSEVNDAKYIYGSYNLTIKQKRLRLNAVLDILIQYLTPDFKAAIQSSTPDQLVRTYGTHLLADIYTGAKLEIAYQAETHNTDRRTASRSGIKAGVKDVFGLDINNDVDRANASQNFAKKLSYFTRGGDPTQGLRGEVNLDNTTPKITISGWQNTATTANAVLVDFGRNGLIPIYNLITDPGKKALVKSYVDKYIEDNQIKLFYRRVPIYSYCSNNSIAHYYTPFNVPEISGDGYSYRRIERIFYAYDKQVPGSIPIYVYLRQGAREDWYYTTINTPFISGPGYSYANTGVLFYAAEGSHISGAIPIAGYLSSASTHYLNTMNVPQFTWPGYVFNREGTAFYAFATER
ncbi:hypothetical protein KTO58_11765 [Chitinophaga pendula]|uniref:MAC/perforin domain-containing protein n=1 Tax=Chitinophaga TaxID=79328 RepID=UPI000BB02142|nr:MULTISPECIES: MAC/perforin domain-containing protein [Chitinophaga]ASZ12557.1 hypothetical protein CK934_17125 [Chitinophaga sp. MD30]UCJ09840.1 hypothetical protein KTO58_11765 [Chitinophaga pendula]